ncbi:hypothetical protein N431DRAFT_454696 [Stipitochalara longipes BDJ]|nr:hypothetical protein N431DRAFT_454696 [Stipitochalara longipes BDJ]
MCLMLLTFLLLALTFYFLVWCHRDFEIAIGNHGIANTSHRPKCSLDQSNSFGWVFGEASILCRLKDCPKEKREKMIQETCQGLGMSVKQDQSEATEYGKQNLLGKENGLAFFAQLYLSFHKRPANTHI